MLVWSQIVSYKVATAKGFIISKTGMFILKFMEIQQIAVDILQC